MTRDMTESSSNPIGDVSDGLNKVNVDYAKILRKVIGNVAEDWSKNYSGCARRLEVKRWWTLNSVGCGGRLKQCDGEYGRRFN